MHQQLRRPQEASPDTSAAAAPVVPSTPQGVPQFLRPAGDPAVDAGTRAGSTMDAGAPDAAPGRAGPTDAGVPLPAGVPPVPYAPTGPDDCATREEQDRKNAFRMRSFSALNFRPSAGYGNFDAYYWPSASLMAAVVKMKFDFVEADNTPSFPTLLQMLLAGQDISPFFWTDAQKRQFEVDYVQRVSSQWSFAHTFRSEKACWPFVARPHVTPRVVDDAADAHFNVTVHKTNSFRGSSFRARNPGTPGWQGTGELDSMDVQDINDHHSDDVARSERQRLERAIATTAASPVLFSHDSDVISAADRSRLQTLAGLMKAKNPSDPGVPMICSGFASAEGGRVHNEGLASRRADAVANELRSAGVPQPVIATGRGPVGAPNDSANRKVELAPDTTFESTYAGNRFAPDAHEFGHAIGLPDEYVNRTSGALGNKQSAFVNLAAAAGVAPPDRWGDRTASVMSAGVDVLPRHYLTIWEALGSMTAPDITRDQWNID